MRVHEIEDSEDEEHKNSTEKNQLLGKPKEAKQHQNKPKVNICTVLVLFSCTEFVNFEVNSETGTCPGETIRKRSE